MPRELKFRAWDKECKLMMPVEELIWDKGAIYLIWALRAEDGEDWTGYDMAPDEVEIMQFTGLRDSQGHEIYEGDILRLTGEKEAVAVVEFADGAFKARSGPDSVAWLDLVLTAADESAVVGNRFENPQMVEGLTCE